MSVFYEKFERHAGGEGLKGHATHYCPGCGHGLVHKYLAEAIEELGIQDRTVAISPVGCSVFLYYYFDVGNSQAAHGRAPAVALGHKYANPESVVISYQGDGDLASIGLAEIVSAAQLGTPITVIFVNNAIYGMTGGQMAPDDAHRPEERDEPEGRTAMMGQPMKMAELIAGLDGPVYVERVALFDAKQRMKAKKAVLKAVKLQAENRGLAFVEVLAECPTHLGMTPEETERWVKEKMLPVFPLGVKKDAVPEPWFHLEKPRFDAESLLAAIGASAERPPRFAAGFPTHLGGTDIALKLAGAGGDGAQTAAMLLTRAAIHEGYDATHIPSYGPESRGGTSYADVHVSADEVLSPASPHPRDPRGVQRPEPREVRAGRAAGRHHPLRQLRREESAAVPRRRARLRRALHGDRRGPRQGDGEEHRRARRAAGRDEALPRGDAAHRHPPRPEGQMRADSPERRGFLVGNALRHAGSELNAEDTMSQDLIPVSLTPAEYRLLMGLRDVPESSLKTRVKALIEALFRMAREPRCPEHQSDGVPCQSVHANCDQCVEVTRMLDGLEAMELQLRGFPG